MTNNKGSKFKEDVTRQKDKIKINKLCLKENQREYEKEGSHEKPTRR